MSKYIPLARASLLLVLLVDAEAAPLQRSHSRHLHRQVHRQLKLGLINGGSSFFEPIQEGFERMCNDLGVTCYNKTAIPPDDQPDMPCNEVRLKLLREFIDMQVDGIAMKPCNLELQVFQEVEAAGIPVVLFDKDVPNSTRIAYVGTEQSFLGRTMAKLLRQLRPEGGIFAPIGYKAERTEGFLEEIMRYNDRTGWSHWYPAAANEEPPVYEKSDDDKFLKTMEWYTAREASAMIVMAQTPMKHPNWTDFVSRHQDITYIGTDGSDWQLKYLDQGYVDGLVGQLPYEMGTTSARVLFDYLQKGSLPKTIYNTNIVSYNLIPLELPPLDVDDSLIGHYRYMGFACFGFVAAFAFLCLGWTFHQRHKAVVRAAQPFFLSMVAWGVLLLAGALVPLSYDDAGDDHSLSDAQSQAMCMSVPWLGFTGFAIAFSELLAKTWRISRLFQARVQHSRIQVTERDVLGPFALLLTSNSVVLVCWTVLDPLQYVREENTGTDYWNRVISSFGGCRSDNAVAYLVPLALLNFSVVVFACFQAYQARDVQAVFSESKYIGLTVASLFQAFSTGIPVIVVVRDMPKAFYLVTTIMIFVLCMAIMSLIFVPKIWMQRTYDDMSLEDQRKIIARSIRQSSVRRITSSKTLSSSKEPSSKAFSSSKEPYAIKEGFSGSFDEVESALLRSQELQNSDSMLSSTNEAILITCGSKPERSPRGHESQDEE